MGKITQPGLRRNSVLRRYKSNKQRNEVLKFSKYLERSIKKLPSSRTGYHFECKALLKRGLILEAWAAHTHPQHTRVPPPPHPHGGFVLKQEIPHTGLTLAIRNLGCQSITPAKHASLYNWTYWKNVPIFLRTREGTLGHTLSRPFVIRPRGFVSQNNSHKNTYCVFCSSLYDHCWGNLFIFCKKAANL